MVSDNPYVYPFPRNAMESTIAVYDNQGNFYPASNEDALEMKKRLEAAGRDGVAVGNRFVVFKR